MILEKLIVENFRQFLGQQAITFATTKKKNITVIHAENGFGKTALLNAILWGFYGQEGLSDDFEHPERILHESLDAANNDDATAVVTILFSDGPDRYTLTRCLSLAQQRDDPRKSRVTLEVLHHGQTIELEKPHWKIESLLPRGIAPFLLFNGERIDHLSMGRNSAQITAAIHQMLGLKLLSVTIEDLQHQNVRGRLIRELRDSTDEETAKIIEREQELEGKFATLQTRLGACKENQTAAIKEVEAIDRNLAANREARELQRKRSNLQDERAGITSRFDEVTKRLKHLVNNEGYVLFCDDLVKRGREIAQRLRNEGKLPARVLNSFIQELLQSGECICGNRLQSGSDAHKKVNKLLVTAGDDYFNNAVSALDNAMGAIKSKIEPTNEALQQMAKDRSELRDQLRRIEDDLHEIHQQLGDKEDAEVHQLESKREEWAHKQRELVREQGAIEQEINQLSSDLENVKRRIAQSQQQAEAAAKAQRRLWALDQMITLLQTILRNEMTDLRRALNEEIDRHFRKIIDRAYWAELTEDFTLRIMKRIAGTRGEEVDVAMSTGQRQITSLVFIASLVALARQRAELPTILKDVEGGEYPMVMDSPFGQLGEEFRTGVAKWIPSLAPQVVIFLSSTQYKGKVEEVLTEQGRIGRRYVLSYHAASKREEAQASLTIGGKRHRIYQQADVEHTQIVAVED